MVDEDAMPGYTPLDIPHKDPEPVVLDVIDRLNRSERPVLLAGGGIRLAGGADTLRELIDILKIPVLTSWNGIDLIEETHPLYYGRPGGIGHRYANFIQQNSDLFFQTRSFDLMFCYVMPLSYPDAERKLRSN